MGVEQGRGWAGGGVRAEAGGGIVARLRGCLRQIPQGILGLVYDEVIIGGDSWGFV